MFAVAFLYDGSLWLLFIVEVPSFWFGLDKWLVKISWLGKLVSVFWWVKLNLFSLEDNEVSSSEFQGVCGFGVTLGSLYFNAQGCVSTLLEN